MLCKGHRDLRLGKQAKRNKIQLWIKALTSQHFQAQDAADTAQVSKETTITEDQKTMALPGTVVTISTERVG